MTLNDLFATKLWLVRTMVAAEEFNAIAVLMGFSQKYPSFVRFNRA
jgi:hypothetical protein